jgi:hypothetical protein
MTGKTNLLQGHNDGTLGPVYGLLLVRALQARWRIFNSELDIKLSRILGFGNFVPSTYSPWKVRFDVFSLPIGLGG